MYVYQRRHVHVETRKRLTKFEVRTQVPPLIHWCVCGEKGDAYMVLWYIHTTTKQQNNTPEDGGVLATTVGDVATGAIVTPSQHLYKIMLRADDVAAMPLPSTASKNIPH
jgi:hypothetical protein